MSSSLVSSKLPIALSSDVSSIVVGSLSSVVVVSSVGVSLSLFIFFDLFRLLFLLFCFFLILGPLFLFLVSHDNGV